MCGTPSGGVYVPLWSKANTCSRYIVLAACASGSCVVPVGLRVRRGGSTRWMPSCCAYGSVVALVSEGLEKDMYWTHRCPSFLDGNLLSLFVYLDNRR